jgi:AbrB family looped-hinge helix DNA binding protein
MRAGRANVRVLRNGQITLPARFRRELGIEQDGFVEIVLEGNGLWLRPVQIVNSEDEPGWAVVSEDINEQSLAELLRAMGEGQRDG